MKVVMRAGARAGMEQDVPSHVARTLVSDGRATYVDAWRNTAVPQEQEQAPEHKPTNSEPARKSKRGRR